MHTLDNLNPSRLLTSAIASHPTHSAVNAKEEDFYLGVLAEDNQVRIIICAPPADLEYSNFIGWN